MHHSATLLLVGAVSLSGCGPGEGRGGEPAEGGEGESAESGEGDSAETGGGEPTEGNFHVVLGLRSGDTVGEARADVLEGAIELAVSHYDEEPSYSCLRDYGDDLIAHVQVGVSYSASFIVPDGWTCAWADGNVSVSPPEGEEGPTDEDDRWYEYEVFCSAQMDPVELAPGEEESVSLELACREGWVAYGP